MRGQRISTMLMQLRVQSAAKTMAETAKTAVTGRRTGKRATSVPEAKSDPTANSFKGRGGQAPPNE
jgi:hypothetical protein